MTGHDTLLAAVVKSYSWHDVSVEQILRDCRPQLVARYGPALVVRVLPARPARKGRRSA